MCVGCRCCVGCSIYFFLFVLDGVKGSYPFFFDIGTLQMGCDKIRRKRFRDVGNNEVLCCSRARVRIRVMTVLFVLVFSTSHHISVLRTVYCTSTVQVSVYLFIAA